ncbi:MAG: CvpA family protein [Rhodanobacter sp.]
MNWTDYIIIGVIALSVMVGLLRGLISEVLALAIWVAAFWVAWLLGPSLATHLEHTITLPSARYIVSYGACFVTVLILGALLRFVIGKLIESTGLSGTDRLLGMLFGFARGVFLVALMVFLIGFTSFTRDPWWQQSVLLPQFQHVAAWLGQQVPPSVAEHLQPSKLLDRVHKIPLTLPAPASSTAPAAATSITAAPTGPAVKQPPRL